MYHYHDLFNNVILNCKISLAKGLGADVTAVYSEMFSDRSGVCGGVWWCVVCMWCVS